jgi:hypothetical protein
MAPDWPTIVAEALKQNSVRSVQTRKLATLWAGYGSITSLVGSVADGSEVRLIAKEVCLKLSIFFDWVLCGAVLCWLY